MVLKRKLKTYSKRILVFITVVMSVIACCLIPASADGVDIGGDIVYAQYTLGPYDTDFDNPITSMVTITKKSSRRYNLSWVWALPATNQTSLIKSITPATPVLSEFVPKGNSQDLVDVISFMKSRQISNTPLNYYAFSARSYCSSYDLSIRMPLSDSFYGSYMYEFKGNSTTWADTSYEWQPYVQIWFVPIWASNATDEEKEWLTQDIINQSVYLTQSIYYDSEAYYQFNRCYTFNIFHPYELGLVDVDDIDYTKLTGWVCYYRTWSVINQTDTRFTARLYDGQLYDGDLIGASYFNFNLQDVYGDYQEGYNVGYSVGYGVGYDYGYDNGYDDGSTSSYSVYSLIQSVLSAPFELMFNILDFDVFGINLASFVKTIFTFLCVAFIIIVALKFIL